MTSQEFFDRIWEILAPVPAEKFEVMAASAPQDADVTRLEEALGVVVPPDVAAFAQRCNGLCVVARDEVWPPSQLAEVRPQWELARGLVFLGLPAPELPEWATVAARAALLRERGVTGVLPLLAIVGTSAVTWGVNAAGQVVQVDDDAVTLLEQSLTDVYGEQVSELLARLAEYECLHPTSPQKPL